MNLKCIVAYDGTYYLGWQKNRDLPTIELHLETAFTTVLRHPVNLEGASRTDAGVHALGQVVTVSTDDEELDLERLQLSVNGLLPYDIRVRSIEAVNLGFHPSVDALGKTYHYHVCPGPVQFPQLRRMSWHYPKELELGAMQAAAELLVGTHDFAAFVNEKQRYGYDDTTCTIESVEIEEGTPWTIKVHGNRFLYKMVRNIAGTLVYVGCGKLTVAQVSELLKDGSRPDAGMTAPAHGLCLMQVHY